MDGRDWVGCSPFFFVAVWWVLAGINSRSKDLVDPPSRLAWPGR